MISNICKLNSSETCIKYFHYHSLHKNKEKTFAILIDKCFLFLTDMSSKDVDIAETQAMGNSSSNTRASQQRKEEPLKIFQNKPKKKLQDIRDMLDPQINLVRKPQDDLERWALGTIYKTVIKVLTSASSAQVLWSSIIMVMAW